jgi:Uncharacterized conserved protein (COG2071)
MNRVPAFAGTIDRRLLINYRVEPDVLRRVLPSRFRPQLIGGVAIAGICMIRLTKLRPEGMPRTIGLTTENAAHRIAVEWDGQDGPRRGVYIPRRDTASRLTVLGGGRFFPGEHHRACFRVHETERRYEVAFTSVDGTAHVALAAELAAELSPGSVFASLDQASTFFEGAPLGYSATKHPGRFEGLELDCARWCVEPLLVEQAESSYFEDQSLFPAGSVQLDSALVMRNIPAIWRAREGLIDEPGHTRGGASRAEPAAASRAS